MEICNLRLGVRDIRVGSLYGYLQGKLDEVRVYNSRALSRAEIQVLYELERPNNNPPTITSPSAYNIAENQQSVATITATDEDGDTLTFSITGGSDASKFAIDPSSGALTFSTARTSTADSNSDNIYEVTISASDGLLDYSKSLLITITDSYEPSHLDHLAGSAANLEMIWVGLRFSIWAVQARSRTTSQMKDLSTKSL